MSNRRKSFDLTTKDPKTVLEVTVRYYKPDGSMADQERQGYWLNISPVKLDGSFRTTTAWTGRKRFLESSKRFSQKKLDDLMAAIRFEIMTGHTEDSFVLMALEVAEVNGLIITQWSKKNQ